jgi:coproporphyrinogen III oxidase
MAIDSQISDHEDDTALADAVAYFRALQDRIVKAFEGFEASARAERSEWSKPESHRLKGGGMMRVLRGDVFEKAGVNFSHVWGEFSDKAKNQVPGAMESGGRFEASGISLVAHMANPYVPAVHMNLRIMRTNRTWFGGGADLTPTFPFDEDTQDFHAALKSACDGYEPDIYAIYKAGCDEYFYLPHRNEPRGVGGIFFDELNSGDIPRDFEFVKSVGEAFLSIYPVIVRRRRKTAFGEKERDAQLIKRGRYVEFNLVYDRGTKFGFATDANPDAYLMSMPPVVKWP